MREPWDNSVRPTNKVCGFIVHLSLEEVTDKGGGGTLIRRYTQSASQEEANDIYEAAIAALGDVGIRDE